jgi:succinoglycan biosynthesis transport protein ExoP
MASALRNLGAQYDMVLVDTPPLLPVADAAAVAPATDGVLLVCRFKKTTRDQLRGAVNALEAVSAPLLGTVFSMVPASGPRAYAQYSGYYRTEGPAEPAVSPIRRLPSHQAVRGTNGSTVPWDARPGRRAQEQHP